MKLAKFCSAELLFVLAVCGCSSNASESPVEATPTPKATATAEVPQPSSEPASVGPDWQDKFTPSQLEVYEAALKRWQEYTDQRNQIYGEGLDTPEARAVLREYSMQWQLRVRELAELYDQGGVRILVPEEAIAWRALSISPTVVLISQCTDYRDVRVTQRGRPVKGTKPDHPITPLIIEMDKTDGRDWMVALTDLKDERSCAG